MTTVKQRSGGVTNTNITSTAHDDNTATIDKYEKKQTRKINIFLRHGHGPSLSSITTIILLLTILVFLGSSINNKSSGSDATTTVSSFNVLRRWYIPRGKVNNNDNGANSVTVSHNSDYNIHVRFNEARYESSKTTSTASRIVSSGPHSIKLTTTCVTNTRWAIRVVGDALLYITLYETQNDNLSSTSSMLSYVGTFSLPIPGTFALEIYGSGSDDCHGHDTNSDRSPFLIDTIPFAVKDNPASQRRQQLNQPGPYLWNRQSLFAPALWLSTDYNPDISTIPNIEQGSLGRYIWVDPTKPRRPITLLDKRIIKEGTVRHNTTGAGFHSFADLSNYELVCFFGGRTAADTWGAFRSLRPHLFPDQRPFKFHLYQSTNMTSPTQHWDENKEKGLRKCKHLLVFTDDWNYDASDGVSSSLTGEEYKARMTIFVNHLLKLLPDDTFPIWIFTMMESPLTPSHCHRDHDNAKSGPMTTEHPCNEILRQLFADKDGNSDTSSSFPERVRLADNTDLSTARLLLLNNNDNSYGDNNATADLDFNARHEIVVFNIALRIFVMVGKQVEVWRSSGQVGREQGLFRNGVKQWEHELIPYKWN